MVKVEDQCNIGCCHSLLVYSNIFLCKEGRILELRFIIASVCSSRVPCHECSHLCGVDDV